MLLRFAACVFEIFVIEAGVEGVEGAVCVIHSHSASLCSNYSQWLTDSVLCCAYRMYRHIIKNVHGLPYRPIYFIYIVPQSELQKITSIINPLTAGDAYRPYSDFHVLLAHSVPTFKHVKDKMWHQSARFEKSWPTFCQIWIIFTHLKLWIASATHNFKWVKIQIE